MVNSRSVFSFFFNLLGTYSHVLPNMQEKAVAAMDTIFEGS